MSVNPRLNRLFTQNGKCLQVALDHGVANEASLPLRYREYETGGRRHRRGQS